MFQRLSIFRGGFTRLAAQKIAGAVLRDLHSLVNKSLLTLSPGGRYDVHELLRQYATEKLAAAPEVEAELRGRHSVYYLNFLGGHDDDWHTGRQLETLATVTGEADNIQRAWQWAFEQGNSTNISPAMDGWAWYYIWRGRLADASDVFGALAEKMARMAGDSESAPPEVLRVWAKALAWHGSFGSNNFSAQEVLQRSLGILDRPELAQEDVRRDRAFVLNVIADRYYSVDRQAARQFREQSLELYRARGDQWGIASGLGSLGYLDWATGDYARAQDRIQASLALHQARGDAQEQNGLLNALAWLYQHLGQMEKSMSFRREWLRLCQQTGNRFALMNSMANLAHGLHWHGDFEEARRWADSALAICLELGDRGEEGYIRLAICMAFMFTGRYDQANDEGALALALLREHGIKGTEASALWALGSVALVRPSGHEAWSAFTESRRLYEEVQDNFLGLALSGLVYAACCERRLEEATAHALEALRYTLRLRDHLLLFVTLPSVALLLALTHETVRALEVWELALAQPFVANSRWHADVAGAPIAAAAAALPPDDVKLARERGRALDLWETAEALVKQLQQSERVVT
jgi:tetratricopeptide (TPR) repeat protein